MVTKQQMRKLRKNYQKSGCNLSVAAAEAGMDRKTAGKWRLTNQGMNIPLDIFPLKW